MGLDQTSFPKLWNIFQKLFGDQKVKLSAVVEMLDEVDLIVDFGCATGLMYPRYMNTFGTDYLGVDIDENALGVARTNFPTAEFSNTTIGSLHSRLEDYRNPCIILSNVLHHMDDAMTEEFLTDLSELPPHVKIVALDPEAKRKSYSLIFRFFHLLEKGDFRRSFPEIINLLIQKNFQITETFEFLGRAPIWPFGPTVQAWGLTFHPPEVNRP